MTTIEVTFWGVRGSNPVSGKGYEKVGGHTSCVSVLINEKRLVVFDAGTGLYDLGNWLQSTSIKTVHLFLSHLHFDHIEGLPFFAPLWSKGYRLHLYSAHKNVQSLFENKIFHDPFFPVTLEIAGSSLIYQQVSTKKDIHLDPGIVIKSCSLNHPGGASGYRLEAGGKSLCYMTDVEHDSDILDPGILRFIDKCDLFIYDSAYTEDEYAHKRGWGHSTHIRAAELAKAAGVGQLALFHHDPSHDDAIVKHVEKEAQAIFASTIAARQGLIVKV